MQCSRGLTVGFTEVFQGQECLVIITTVRSRAAGQGLPKLGFLTYHKRFNVAVTKAKALLIIIGNPYALNQDPHWRSLLKFRIDKGAYTRAMVEDSSDKIEELVESISQL